MAFASWWYATHGSKNASGASKEKKGAEATEKRTVITSKSESPKSQTSGVSSVNKAQTSVASKTSTMKPAEAKASSSQQQTRGVDSQKRKRNRKKATPKPKAEPEKVLQDKKADESQPVAPVEGKQRDPGGAKCSSKDSLGKEPKQPSLGKEAAAQNAKSTQLATTEEGKANTDNKPLASKVAVGTAGTVTAAALTATTAETKEDKRATPAPVTADSKPAEKSDLDTALDDLINTLGSPEENEPPAPTYTGPEVSDPMLSLNIEELGKRESTIPPEYRKLLESKGDGKITSPSVAVGESQPTMTDDDLADALSSDFTCTIVPSAGEKEVRPKEPAAKDELLQAHSTTSVSSSAPPKEKKPKLEEVTISDSALDALVDTLGMPEPEPEEDTSSIVEVEEPKAVERKEKKPGERDDTIPPEYRLKPTLDKDGKPLLPTPEEKPKPITETELIDEFSKDFVCPASSTEKSKPAELADKSKKPVADEPSKTPKEKVAASPIALPVQPLAPSKVSPKPESTKPQNTSAEEAVSASTVPSVKSSAPTVTSPSTQATNEALEALSGSLGKNEPAPEEKKPAVDKVKEKSKKEKHEKLGEKEETIPPDYRLTEVKDKDGKPLLPKPEEKPQPLSESELLDALSEGFSCSAPASTTETPLKSTGPSKPAVPAEEVISAAAASAVHSSVPKEAVLPGRKDLDDAADLLADTLGQREPDPDENKPFLDKVKEKAKAEHLDKLGERDDTIPPEYRHLLDSDEKGKPIKPKDKDGEKPKEQTKPDSDSAAIDALSGDFDHCVKPVSQPPSTKEEKSKGAASSKPRKEEKKSKTPKKVRLFSITILPSVICSTFASCMSWRISEASSVQFLSLFCYPLLLVRKPDFLNLISLLSPITRIEIMNLLLYSG
ncbi:calpastatin isoform X2 [Thamnophis elegans]|uniref:calpastatin isoform X2 n=1 Tax=Thamnophis elegans TaxID=35005 RepID=UPI0013771B2D|nr:calpastatin isoform X2 [Thamnophis elegans]